MTDVNQGTGDGAQPNGAAAAALNSPPPAPAFYESFQDAGLKEWATNAKFESPEAVAKIAHKFDALKDMDPATLRALPKADDPNAVVAHLKELGVPQDVSGYAFDKIEGVDAARAAAIGDAALKAGLLPFQAQLLAEADTAFNKAQNEAQVAAEKADAEREMAQLKTEWGSEYTPKLELARRSAKALGVDADTMNYLESGMGAGPVIRLFERASKFFKEGDFVDGDRGNQPMSLLEKLYPNDVAKDRGQR